MTNLSTRKALVTGAASGIGLAVARSLLGHGASVGLIDRDTAALAALEPELRSSPGTSMCQAADVSDERAVVRAVDAIASTFGSLDVVICAAGIDHEASLGETELEAWRRVLDVNLTGVHLTVRAALPALRASGSASVVIVSSGAGLRPIPRRSAYCASKAGVIMYAKSLALELAADGVRVNSVCPGATDTPLLRHAIDGTADPETTMTEIVDRYPLRRLGTVGEIAAAILFLASDDASYVTGAALAVDGGRTLH